MFILFDMQFDELNMNKDMIYKIAEDKIVLNLKFNYKLAGIISTPKQNHFNTIIFNPFGFTIDTYFKSNLIYYHDGLMNEGRIIPLEEGQDWKSIEIPYVPIYKKIDCLNIFLIIYFIKILEI